jgi:hypothetical protein
MKKEISLIAAASNSHWIAAWMHMTAGYDAGYYGNYVPTTTRTSKF